MECKVDYLTCSIVPNIQIDNVSGFADFLISFFCLSDLYSDFQQIRCGQYYSTKLIYNNIVIIKIPSPQRSTKQGFLIEFTGQGVDFLIEHIKSKFPDEPLRRILANFLLLGEADIFKCKITRFDLAFDDISFDSDKYMLNFDDIKESLLSLQVVSPFHLRKAVKKMEITFYEIGTNSLDIKGDTIYIGSRSGTHIRFYDKIAEMTVHNKPFDEKIKHWVRMEFQLMGENAMAAVIKYVHSSSREFNEYISEVVNDYIRFVDVTEKNVSNIHRCKSKKWWSDFVGTITQSKLIHKKPVKNLFLSAVDNAKKTAATTYSIISCIGLKQFVSLTKEGADEHYNKRHQLIQEDYRNLDSYEAVDLRGIRRYSLYTADAKECLKLRRELKRLCEENNSERIRRAAESGKYKSVSEVS